MDEQTSPAPETPVITPDPVVADTLAVEPPQAEPAEALAEPVVTAETPQIEQPSEPLPATTETPTPHLPVDEALPETAPEPAPQGAVKPAEAPKEETPRTPPEIPSQPQATPQPAQPRIPQT